MLFNNTLQHAIVEIAIASGQNAAASRINIREPRGILNKPPQGRTHPAAFLSGFVGNLKHTDSFVEVPLLSENVRILSLGELLRTSLVVR